MLRIQVPGKEPSAFSETVNRLIFKYVRQTPLESLPCLPAGRYFLTGRLTRGIKTLCSLKKDQPSSPLRAAGLSNGVDLWTIPF